MLTSPVAAARAAVATEALGEIETRHVSDTWECGSLSFMLTHPPEDKREKTKKGKSLKVCLINSWLSCSSTTSTATTTAVLLLSLIHI